MKYADFLSEGGSIGFVAPAFGASTEPYISGFNSAVATFEEMGYKTVIGPNCYKGDGIGISTNPYDCGKELTESYLADDTDILIPAGGGELMCETIDYVDFSKIKASKPKWFIGYSDNTNFTFLLNTICDHAAIYGQCASNFGMKPWHQAIHDSFDILTGKKLEVSSYGTWELKSLKTEDNPLVPYNTTEKLSLVYYGCDRNSTSFKGRLLGGCLDCLCNLVGTKYDYVKAFNDKYGDEGIIWFFESCDLNVFSIRRALWQLDRSGWFDHAAGFLVGRPMQYGQDMFGLNQYNAVTDILGKYNVPIIMDADIGHLPPAMPIISGAYGYVEASKDKLNIRYELK